MAGRTTGALALLLVLLSGAALAAASPEPPDLVVTTVSVSRHRDTLRIVDTTRNEGLAAAPRSTTSYFLGSTRLGVRSVSRLRAGAASRGSKTLAISASAAPGSYRLRVCADGGSVIREANERNNCRATLRRVRVLDRAPPRFAGLLRATTCIPGPAGGEGRSSRYTLAWAPADDNVTPRSRLVYEVYQATAPGGEDFSAPTYAAPRGATSFATPLLAADVTYYFVVRARDEAGNRDSNAVERPGVNLCLAGR